ncbi:LuxS/MPP-like metallohydrolase [Metschnikowia bicuspidata var. bicuspidata NRRL YB-4993]|uniref:Cytochrome b-c1 complex subunit 2, mitochondrial n=1 Tax=Metschnikowia bicuspidata var. bicuspidata NRRL YB-4993 TaxID=869754 RepID=A0A1A0H685_9ASCO|nr:LuxS/MPP-like metallohydrolase [Metschnikowia bicuspidata var. bicuspidata NRRL YB-4993]OBA19541.1 LuxS/MPP-like metallohydrolase [Metschnikowia bicuspidata var. bicuspidata NRRL YB-4993]
MLSRVSARAYSTAPVKLVSRDAAGALSTLSAVVGNAGSKTGKAGVAHLLAKYAFLNTETKSALRLARESELLGGRLAAHVTRDALVLSATFLKQDLPYYVDALASVLAKPAFRPHEFVETVLPVARAEAAAAHADNGFVGLEALHQLSFRKGLGQPLYYSDAQSVALDEVMQFAAGAYTAGNVRLVALGVNEADLAGFVAGSAFAALPAGASPAPPVTTYTGAETRLTARGASYAAFAVPVAPKDFAKYEVLAAAAGTSVLPGAAAPLRSIAGADSRLYKYQDAGLFVVSVRGADGAAVAEGIKAAKKTVAALSASDLAAATKAAQLAVALQESFEFPHDNAVSAASGKGAKLGAFNYVAVGNTDVLPYADEL